MNLFGGQLVSMQATKPKSFLNMTLIKAGALHTHTLTLNLMTASAPFVHCCDGRTSLCVAHSCDLI